MIAVRKQRKNKNIPRKASKVQVQLKQQLLRELKKETAARNNRQKKILSKRPRRQKKYQNLSGVQGTRQNQGFGNKKRIVVSETEYIGEVTIANQPNYQNLFSLPVNPGQSSTFPWLSSIAKNYEKYCFRELTFFYKPEVTEYTANVNTGKVILSGDYDASDAPPATKQQQEDVDPHADGMPYQTISLTLDPKELHQNSVARFVRIGGLPGSADIKTYDAANFFLSTQGQTANSTIGELHVRYVVELTVPVIEDIALPPNNYHVSSFRSTTSEAAGTSGGTKALLFATSVVNGLNIVNTSGVFVPPPGNYLLDIDLFAQNTSGTLNSTALDVQKNSTSYYPTLGPSLDTANPGSSEWHSLHSSLFITANGTDEFAAISSLTYSSGSPTLVGYIRFVAI